VSFIHALREKLVAEKGLHDLSRNAELARFPLIGYRLGSAALDFAAFVRADELTESQVAALRDGFFDAVRTLSTEFSLRTSGLMPNGLLGFVFEEGCTERMARFIRRQTRISHGASTGAVTVSWAIDVAHRLIHTHENPVSVLPPVIVLPQTVYPGLAWLESALLDTPAAASEERSPPPSAPAPAAPAQPVPTPPAERVRILFLGANSMSAPMDLGREVSRIEDELRSGDARDTLEFHHVADATIDRTTRAMLKRSPTIVHFAGHGSSEGIYLRDEMGNPRLVTGAALAGLIALFRRSVKCVVLNACWSEGQARAIREHIPHVIGTRAAIQDTTALVFSVGFYQAIAAGWDVPSAFEMGKARVGLEGCGGEDVPVLL
jgi:hypothetical protein